MARALALRCAAPDAALLRVRRVARWVRLHRSCTARLPTCSLSARPTLLGGCCQLIADISTDMRKYAGRVDIVSYHVAATPRTVFRSCRKYAACAAGVATLTSSGATNTQPAPCGVSALCSSAPALLVTAAGSSTRRALRAFSPRAALCFLRIYGGACQRVCGAPQARSRRTARPAPGRWRPAPRRAARQRTASVAPHASPGAPASCGCPRNWWWAQKVAFHNLLVRRQHQQASFAGVEPHPGRA